MKKICDKCKQEKDIALFKKTTRTHSGYTNICKKCHNEYNRQYYLLHLDERQEYRDTHKDDNAKYQKIYQKENELKLKEYGKEYRIKNKNIIPAKQKAYRQTHKDKRNKYMSEYMVRNLNSRISHNLRTRIGAVLSGRAKGGKLTALLGCDIPYLKLHLESLFKEGMSWDNYGIWGWHIDHIIPCDSFDLSNIEEQRRCFHYSNLQPLWAPDNISKKNKILK